MSRHLLSPLFALMVPAISLMGLATTNGCHPEAAQNTAPQQTEPRAGEGGNETPGPDAPATPESWSIYMDPTYGFNIHYPNGFVVRQQDVSELSQFTPTPLVSTFFMNPAMAAGELAGAEPPDLEVRVYRAEAADSLQAWLVSAGFASSDSIGAAKPFQNANVSGLEVCHSTMIAPGCSVYVLRNGRVYQLTAISKEGEAMIRTFGLESAGS